MSELTSEVAEAVYGQLAKIVQTCVEAIIWCIEEKNFFSKSGRKWLFYGDQVRSKLTSEVDETVYSQSAKIGQNRLVPKYCIREKTYFAKSSSLMLF